MTIVGLIAVATLSEFATELRVGAKSNEARVMDALARDRLSVLRLTPTEVLEQLPDSLTTGTFAAPFSDHDWSVELTPERTTGLIEVQVQIRSPQGQFTVATRLFRPHTRVDRPRP